MLLQAQRDVNRGLDKDVHDLMGQLEDLNRRYAALGRRTASLQVWQPPPPLVLPSQVSQSVPEAANFDRCLGTCAQPVSFRSAHRIAIMSVACVLCSLNPFLGDTWHPCQFAAGPMTRRSWPQLRLATSDHFGSGCSGQRRQTLIWSRCLQHTALLTSTFHIGCTPAHIAFREHALTCRTWSVECRDKRCSDAISILTGALVRAQGLATAELEAKGWSCAAYEDL